MTDDTLLAHLAPRLTNRTEDIAVRALWYILSKSEMARNALEETLKTQRLRFYATSNNYRDSASEWIARHSYRWNQTNSAQDSQGAYAA